MKTIASVLCLIITLGCQPSAESPSVDGYEITFGFMVRHCVTYEIEHPNALIGKTRLRLYYRAIEPGQPKPPPDAEFVVKDSVYVTRKRIRVHDMR